MFDGRFRHGVDKRTGPVAVVVRRTGLTADHLTVLGLVMAVAAAVTIGSGRLLLGLVLFVLSAIPDLLDGPVAKASGTASVRGAFFDSTADRVTDALVLGGIAWHLQDARGGHWAMLAFAVLGVSTLVSYQRAKAESLGFDARGGLMERAERIIALCLGLLVPVLLVPVLWVMLALTAVTAVQRFVKVWRQASVARVTELAARGVEVPEPKLFRATRDGVEREPFEVRLQAWRDANAATRAARRQRRVAANNREPLGSRWRERRSDRPTRPRRTRP
ncbi:MAG: CDP-diacylglycerol--glycerol-3-phosphate 3-phosphatidyltransferase [uncultured Acidimicrobiales bacterium]|uniref:CDP-diacylglycerol--glycerol-3-phosphate 3-phosphatidyltransferase n=1 Tax=uncultured Acidimicrobiales bacterium TaxID=310071 RepID=A0A6J4H559_9ACTN|nr:MAG: CDP-diacylglycerol--glycerol-3-phosphate 3-phosphatidyltransferase [uncultured Acidimicrobiales bacterium]